MRPGRRPSTPRPPPPPPPPPAAGARRGPLPVLPNGRAARRRGGGAARRGGRGPQRGRRGDDPRGGPNRVKGVTAPSAARAGAAQCPKARQGRHTLNPTGTRRPLWPARARRGARPPPAGRRPQIAGAIAIRRSARRRGDPRALPPAGVGLMNGNHACAFIVISCPCGRRGASARGPLGHGPPANERAESRPLMARPRRPRRGPRRPPPAWGPGVVARVQTGGRRGAAARRGGGVGRVTAARGVTTPRKAARGLNRGSGLTVPGAARLAPAARPAQQASMNPASS
jgi:hypothetical protein